MNENKAKSLSLLAMKFGSEEDFKTAVTELRWIIETFGKAIKRDFEKVSSKYNLPINFLKKGLKGLDFPDDYRISKSKWFPVLYSWVCQKREISYKLFRLQIDYKRAVFWSIVIFVMLISMSQMFILLLHTYFGLDLLEMCLLIITFALFLVALFFEMRNPLTERKIALDDYCYLLRQRGLGKIIEENERFLRNYNKSVLYAGHIIKEKLESGWNITVFTFHTENGKLVINDYETPDLEYRKRISELYKA